MKPRKRHRPTAAKGGDETYVFRLFVAGNEPNSAQARKNLSQLCEAHLKGRYKVKIVDVLKDATSALRNNVLVTPTLMVIEPRLEVTLFGNLNDTRAVLAALGLNGNGR